MNQYFIEFDNGKTTTLGARDILQCIDTCTHEMKEGSHNIQGENGKLGGNLWITPSAPATRIISVEETSHED